MLTHHHHEADSPKEVDSLSDDPRWETKLPDHEATHSMVIWWHLSKSPLLHTLIGHIVNNYLTSYLVNVCLPPYTGSSKNIFLELSRMAPTRCLKIIYWMHECQCNLKEQRLTLLSVLHGKWQALTFWGLRSHWDKCK